ncbi:hypothetical protein [Nitrosomonas mobilis]|uniref:hypothetical protein n=1 Tax=Nitrosomonas mobilis TaxID=51642 RepID=UPI00159FDD62|nr:hypothetical protein [Nitrosomonas mobilis]
MSGISGLQDCRKFWEIPVEGNVGMDQDPGKPFSGDSILVKGVVRVCLMNDMELDIGAGIDDSYYDLDEAEA